MPRPSRVPILLALLLVTAACATPIGTPTGSEAASPGATNAPSSATPTDEPTATPTAQPSASAPMDGTTYTVRPGDSLAAIAGSFGTTTPQLQAWNSGRYPSLASNPNLIEPGWVLTVSGHPGVTPIPAPAPTAPPVASGCTANNRVAAGSAQTLATIPNAGPGVALTFDMGGRMDPAVDIMNFLVANGVCATIFATGVMSNTPQGQQVLGMIRAHPNLFEIANHTMYHCDLARGGGGSPSTGPCAGSPFSADRIRTELTDAEAILVAGTGQAPQPYWRPPYGSLSDGVIAAAASVGYTKTFLWDIDTIDWKPITDGGPTAEQIAAKVIGNAVNGSNVLFHLGGYETLRSLELIVPGLRDRGLTLTSLSDLLN
jgi:peptidoglycan/xylan/chitin deacetylase (PgdA/CDA1 family)